MDCKENREKCLSWLNECIFKIAEDSLEKNVVKTICPIYFEKAQNDKYEGIGSGFFLKFRGHRYFITAAHCLYDSNRLIEGKCWVYSNRHIFNLQENSIFQQVYLGNHQTKDDDIAIFKIIASDNDDGFDCWEIDDSYKCSLSMNTINSGQSYYGVAIGFPSNRNQSKDTYRRRGAYVCSHGTIISLNNKILNELNVVRNKNIVLFLGRHTKTESGAKGNFINPKGMSGGALYAFSQDMMMKKLNDKCCQIIPELVGVIIEYHQLKGKDKYFLAICFNEIIDRLKLLQNPTRRAYSYLFMQQYFGYKFLSCIRRFLLKKPLGKANGDIP